MKKWVSLVVLSLILSISFVNFSPFFHKNGGAQPEVKIVSNLVKREPPVQKIKTIDIYKNQVFRGDLLLVNNTFPIKQNSIKEDIAPLSSIAEMKKQFGTSIDSISISKEVGLAFSNMMKAANKDGLVHFSVNSGFRSFEEQARLYNELGSAYALPPGYSEHNLGLSIDVGSTLMKMESAPEGKWMEESAWKYGFILRYPKDKTDITGIEYEPWHFRYVGLPHSAIMKEMDLVLEEYIEYLKKEKTVKTTVDEKEYFITYHPASETVKIVEPILSQYEVSGNNVDGVIITRYQ
ncbi:M15 family metallopeptidase [Bacillus sp. REN16]|uniref:M15 family metallopeptidase n=1 Tax=Bacillus sp. REN16 TaxID=2887296 RepID=UPI001E37E78A|nr:M15 family metallopeptidase [Bacillus sp. REN16]MCC3359153.1 M15 family metallopeptidase [Bacillus sp. REN16]